MKHTVKKPEVRSAGTVEHKRCAEITTSARTLIPQVSFTHVLYLPSGVIEMQLSQKALMAHMLLELTFCRPRTGREAILKYVSVHHSFPLRHDSKPGNGI